MTDSTPEKDDAPKGEVQEKKMVPVEAVASERAQKRAAREEADAAKAELEKVRGVPNIPDDVIQALAAEARRAVEAEVAPLKERAARAELGVKHGLNETQVAKVFDIKSKNPTLNDDQALTLARAENPDAFRQPSQSWSRGLHGGLPVSGTSDARSGPAVDDHRALMREAESKGDRSKAHYHAREAALQQFRDAFNNRPIR